jgi:choline dehydrogenase
MREDHYDIVIVGGGSAGCVLANRLSARPSLRVALVEAGGRGPWTRAPIGDLTTTHDPRFDWCYKTEPEPNLNGRTLQWPRGKVLGGSSASDGRLDHGGQAGDYDTWRRLGNPGWSYQDVAPYFRRAEDQEHCADPRHAPQGPLAMSSMRVTRDLRDAFIRAAGEIGVPTVGDVDGERPEGAGPFQLTARNRQRGSRATAVLGAAEKRPNLRVITHAHVERVCLRGGRASGVEYYREGEHRRARASLAVVLAAGAIGSPQLLQLSGIGPPAVLARVGVPVVQALPGVGRNLQDHLQIRCVFRCTRATLNDALRHPLRRLGIALEYLLRRSGPLRTGAIPLGVLCRSTPELDTPDLQLQFQPLSADRPGEALHRFSAFTASVFQLRPQSRGRIELKSPDPYAYPAIHPNYLATTADRRAAVDGVSIARRLCATRAMRPFVAEELLPGPAVQDDDALLEAAGALAHSMRHPVGSCRMGTDTQAVVDPRLRVHGVAGLRVVDASVMPTITSGDTDAPTIMIAEKGSDLVLEDLDG